MGGEPTFVAVDDRDAAEWNTDALGPTKRGLATELVHRLAAKYGQGAFLHFGQGKWYPGEQLPRWALSICWRADGQPCWNDPSWFADERDTHRYTAADAQTFLHTLTRRLGLDTAFVQPAFEDTYYYLWRERRLPVNVDPFDARLDDEMERARLHRVFNQGLKAEVGHVLPLKREWRVGTAGPAWVTGPWFLRDDRMYLIPGDSPMGYRLPLDSQAWAAQGDRPWTMAQDPFAPQAALPSAAALRMQQALQRSAAAESADGGLEGDGFRADAGLAGNTAVAGSTAGSPAPASGPGLDRMGTDHAPAYAFPRDPLTPPAPFESAGELTRTALCVEVRDPQRGNGPKAEREHGGKSGVLYLFMPPLKFLEDYLELLAAIEATCVETGMKIVIEGYGPPRDPRLKTLAVTPDPGVIEVNIHPAHNWAELVDHTEFLGGATPADSPFLRRPDVLASLITYWHNHPSLSYLFSGLFIGPTSQAPRFDEARGDQVYEVEIGLNELDRQMQSHGQVPPWLVDRTLRNLLVDVTGNTHRSEFCIDKLYSPDGPTGRLGLLELRAFEMPPHAHMSLAQQLLLRALLAWFWREPYRGRGATRLTRWGTGLHDRFLLPSFAQLDFDDVMADLNAAGFAFDGAWFAPHFAFRFPLVGDVAVMGIELTLRNALEPWHVMGEEGSAGGTVRYVDSSLERLEVKATGLNGNRHVVTVNGRALPMQPTGRVGEFVCGVRYRAWQPPSALHPTIPVHAPLTFDIVDSWQHRSLGGCRYHVAHPGGRNHDAFPVNAYEAESRRLARFFRFGHTPGRLQVQPAAPSLEHPFTIDLRV
jgi:uncharacterized protein (DUF2126 family)